MYFFKYLKNKSNCIDLFLQFLTFWIRAMAPWHRVTSCQTDSGRGLVWSQVCARVKWQFARWAHGGGNIIRCWGYLRGRAAGGGHSRRTEGRDVTSAGITGAEIRRDGAAQRGGAGEETPDRKGKNNRSLFKKIWSSQTPEWHKDLKIWKLCNWKWDGRERNMS